MEHAGSFNKIFQDETSVIFKINSSNSLRDIDIVELCCPMMKLMWRLPTRNSSGKPENKSSMMHMCEDIAMLRRGRVVR